VEEGVVFEGFDVGGVDGDDAVDVLETAVEDEEGLLRDDLAVFFEGGGGDEGVGDAGFVFEADEEVAFGGAGALAADDEAGDAELLVVWGLC